MGPAGAFSFRSYDEKNIFVRFSDGVAVNGVVNFFHADG
jgi:hypothetical protein